MPAGPFCLAELALVKREKIEIHFPGRHARRGEIPPGPQVRAQRTAISPTGKGFALSSGLCQRNQPPLSRASSTSSMADSISAAWVLVRGWDSWELPDSTDTASIFTADW